MTTTLFIIASGLIAALVMATIEVFLQYLGMKRSEMIKVIGSIFTRGEQRSLRLGWLIHLVLGIVFAFLYAFVWSYFDEPTRFGYLVLGAVTGFLHGLAVSIMLVISVAEHNENPAYRKNGFTVALSFIGTHVIYGLALALLYSSFEHNFDVLSQVATLRRQFSGG